MQHHPGILTVLALLLSLNAQAGPPQSGAPQSSSPALEQAASALAASDFDLADRRFAEVSNDPQSPAFIRGLAMMGSAQTALARGAGRHALQIWRQIATNQAWPKWQRDLAQRRALETERGLSGRPERAPTAYRTSLPVLPRPAAVFYLSASGDDAADGSKRHPFATLTRARDAVREFKKARGGSLPFGGVKIVLRDGDYTPGEPMTLQAEDSGTAEAPIVFEAQHQGKAVLRGGRPISGWKPVADPALRDKLDPAVRDKVLEADLKANGISDWGDATSLKKRPELFVDGAAQTLSRWPNEGFVKTGEILGTNTFKVWGSIPGCKDGKFHYSEDRPARWVDEPDVRLYGYWFWDWFEEYQKVASIDAVHSSFTLTEPFSNYGYRKGQRYFAVNVFRELDRPGEWYLDRRSGKLYWLPPDGLAVSKANIVLSLRSEPFVVMKEAQHILLVGLTFQESRGDGLRITGGEHCLVAGCTLRRLGGDAVIIDGGTHHGIFGCAMYNLGCGAMRVAGGDRQTLSPGYHVVENCTVADIARLKRTYAPAVHLDGCGNRIAHNLFERIPSSAMRIEGNDHLIELNCIRHVVQESDDQGGIDMYGNPLYRGVVIRWNRWSDITGGTECGAAGIRLDDMISGTLLQENLFERCGAVQFGAVQIHGGKENVVDGNVFVDCHAAVSFSRWDEKRWQQSVEPFLKQAAEEPYSTRYPDLARLKSDPNANFVTRNLLFGCKNAFLRDGGVEKTALMTVSEKPAPAELSRTGRLNDSTLRGALFHTLPTTEMGTYSHPWRAAPAR